jgi:hypothetical protein
MYFILLLITFFSFFSCNKKDISSVNDNSESEDDEGGGYVVYAGSGKDPFVKPSYYSSVPIGVIRKDEGILDYGHIIYEGYMEIYYHPEPFADIGG